MKAIIIHGCVVTSIWKSEKTIKEPYKKDRLSQAFSDPTASAAIRNIVRDEQIKERNKRRKKNRKKKRKIVHKRRNYI